MASGSSELDARGHLDAATTLLDECAALGALRTPGAALRPGWLITAGFYASLHAISAYVVARHGVQVVAHRDRTEWFRSFPELAQERFPFTSLKKQSEAFRYYAAAYTWDEADRSVAVARRIVAKWSDRARQALAPRG
jgi:hypothetical protein